MSSAPRSLLVAVTGLRTDVSAQVWQAAPVVGGGYRRSKQLGTTSSSLNVLVPVGAYVEAAPIDGSGDRWEPVNRFQRVADDTETLTFGYKHKFMVTVGIGTTGGSFGGSGGNVSPDPHWVADGQTITFTATPAAGFRFVHWGLFDYPGPSDEERNSGTTQSFTVTITKPINLVATFVSNQ